MTLYPAMLYHQHSNNEIDNNLYVELVRRNLRLQFSVRRIFAKHKDQQEFHA